MLTYVLRAIARRLPGEVEDTLLAILRKPIMILIVLTGWSIRWRRCPCTPGFMAFLEKLLQTILILVVLYLLWRLIKDVDHLLWQGMGAKNGEQDRR